MFSKRSPISAGRRLRVELLEDRAVPAILTGDETDPGASPTDPTDDPTKPVITGEAPPTDTSVDGEPVDPDVIFTTTAIDDDPDGGGEVTDTSVPDVDLATTTTVDKARPSLGDVVTVTVKVMNLGLDPATGVAVATTLPAGMTFVSAATANGTFDEATGSWAAGQVLPGASATLKVKARVTDVASQSVSASIADADQPDPKEQNNAASATVSPVLGSLRLTQSVTTKKAAVGSVVGVTLTLRNTGQGTARDIQVTEALGPGLAFVRALTPTRGTYVPAGTVWKIPALPGGMTAMITLVAQVTRPGAVALSATATATGIDPARSQLDATAGLTGVRTLVPAAWSYIPGQGYQPGPRPTPPRPTNPTPTPTPTPTPAPTPAQPNIALAQFLVSRGFFLPGGFRL
jgi:uncharacterized repeat protein (TIGR01451 family)